MENNELLSIQKKISELEKRIQYLESFANGSSEGKSGRKSKLSYEQKIEIIQKHKEGISYSILAKEYQVSRSTICNICHGHNPLIVSVVHHSSSRK